MAEVLVDANILLRHLTGQPPLLARRAAEIMRAAERGRFSLVVLPLTMAECVWVLETSYRQSRAVIADALLTLVQARGIVARERDSIVTALNLYRETPHLDFADAYLAAVATVAGPPQIASFDERLRGIPGLTVIPE